MQTSAPKQSLLVRLQLRLAAARFFTFSALIHCVLIVLGGGVVLFQQRSEPPDFTAGDGTLITDSAEPQSPPVPVASVTPDQPAPTAPTLPASSIEALVSTTQTPTPFAMNHSAKLAQPAIPAGDVNEAVRNAVGKAGTALKGGMIGGTARFFGETEPTANGFTGTFYDLKQKQSGKPTDVTPDEYHKIYRKFVRDGWRQSALGEYFHSPKKLYAPQIFIPNMPADEGPKAFDLGDKVKPSRWLVHYKARVSPPADGTYHFVGGGDDVLVVRFNGKVVLDRCWHQHDEEWKATRNYDYGYTGIPNGFARGDAMRLKAGQFYDMEVLIGEQPGGLVFFSLLIEEEGIEYRRDARGNPILPVFRLAGGPLPELQNGQTFPPYDPVGAPWKAAPMKTGTGSALDEFFPPK